jgi:hypothetical protein
VPKLLHACVPEDPGEESKIRKLAGSRHAPGDWILRAQIVSLSWQGLRTARMHEEAADHPGRELTEPDPLAAAVGSGLGAAEHAPWRPRPRRSRTVGKTARSYLT